MLRPTGPTENELEGLDHERHMAWHFIDYLERIAGLRGGPSGVVARHHPDRSGRGGRGLAPFSVDEPAPTLTAGLVAIVFRIAGLHGPGGASDPCNDPQPESRKQIRPEPRRSTERM